VGFKHGRWVDIVFMQRALNGGDETPPTGAGLDL
jgi:phosphinothricin acetyltransferase